MAVSGPESAGTPRARSHSRRLSAADAARVAMFAALIGVLGVPGSFPLLGNAVPVTLQTLGVMLAGAILGAWRGALSVLVLLALVAAGLPLLAGGRGGLGVFVGPSVGYLAGFVAGAALVGLLVQRAGRAPGTVRVFLACAIGGIGAVYAFGIPLQAVVTGVPLDTTAALSLVFLPGDLIKAALATFITVGVLRAYPGASPVGRRERTATGVRGQRS